MHPGLRLFLVVLLLVATSVGAVERDTFEEAERRFSAGAYTLAIERYERLLSDYPGSEFTSRAHFRIAQSQYYLGNFEAALERLQRVAVRTPRGTLAQQIRLWIGLVSYQLERYQDAIASFDRFLQQEPDQPGRALLYRGLARLELDDVPGARDDLERAVELTERTEQGFAAAVLLEILSRQGLTVEALALWDRIGDQLDRDDGYHEQRVRYLADAAYQEGRISLATDLYRELVEFSSAGAQWGYQRLYAIAREQDDRERMQELFRSAERRLAAEPERMTDFWYSLGVEAITAGRYELAELHLFRVWDVRSERSVTAAVPRLLARAIERQGRPMEAVRILRESLSDPHVQEGARAERVLAGTRLLLSQGLEEEALELVETLQERTTDSAVLYAWTFSLYRNERGAEVLEILSRNDLQPVVRERPDLMRLYARVQLEEQRPAESVRTFREYLSDRPDDTAARLEFVRALVAAEQFSAAAQEADVIALADLSERDQQELLYLRGLTAFHDGRFEDAEEMLSIVIDPDYEPLRSYHLAWARYRRGAVALARDTIHPVVEDLPERLLFDGGYLYSWTLYQSGESEESIRRLLQLLGSALEQPQEIQVRRLLATVYLGEGEIDSALAQYERLITLAEDDRRRASFRSRYASTLAAVGRWEEAVDQFDELHARFPALEVGRDALLEAGQVLYAEASFAESRDRFRAYQNRYPSGPDLDRALYWAGATSLELDEAARALLWWEPLISEFPRSPFTPRALIGTARIYTERGQQRQALELYDRFVAAYPDDSRAAEAERERRRIRLELDGLSSREAELWVELEPAERSGPREGSDRWFDLVLELGRIAIREQITLTTQRNRIVEYLIEGARFEGNPAARSAVLLAEYYRRRGETRAALEQYVRAASTPGVEDELAAQSLYELAVLAREQNDEASVQSAVTELRERFEDSIWADRAQRLLEQN